MTLFEGVLGIHGRASSGYRQSLLSIFTRASPVFVTQSTVHLNAVFCVDATKTPKFDLNLLPFFSLS